MSTTTGVASPGITGAFPDERYPLRCAHRTAACRMIAVLMGGRAAEGPDHSLKLGFAFPLRERVVDWKHRFFARSWARYDLARPGTFRLVPSPARVSELHADYNAMRDMFIRPPPPFNEVIATLAELERRINEEAPR